MLPRKAFIAAAVFSALAFTGMARAELAPPSDTATPLSSKVFNLDDQPPAPPPPRASTFFFDPKEGNRIHFDFGLAYSSGIGKVSDAVNNAYSQAGFETSSFYIPVGVKADLYYLFDFGLGIGGSIGPVTLGEVNGGSGSIYGIVPVGLDARYVFFNPSKLLPYVRVGARYPIAFGNEVSHAQIGPFVAVGVEYVPWHIGVECAYDGSKVTAGYNGVTQTIKPNEFMVEIFLHI